MTNAVEFCSRSPSVLCCCVQKLFVMQKKILIVDDNAELTSVLRAGFKELGFVVRTASNGVDALKKVYMFKPDAIILDLVLPEMDGFAVCEHLKKNRATASIPVIVLTGLSSQLSRLAGFESGASEYLTKPFQFEELIAKVNALLEKLDAPAVVAAK
jgi:two-component system alkaline phosphatase synthesis response regulator PhoP